MSANILYVFVRERGVWRWFTNKNAQFVRGRARMEQSANKTAVFVREELLMKQLTNKSSEIVRERGGEGMRRGKMAGEG